jgi:hypothetical protein
VTGRLLVAGVLAALVALLPLADEEPAADDAVPLAEPEVSEFLPTQVVSAVSVQE